MNKHSITRALAAGAVILTVNISVQAQLGGALNRAREAASKTVQGASEQAKQSAEDVKQAASQTVNETTQAAEQSVNSATSQVTAAAGVAPPQPWAIGETRSSTAPASAVQATYADGVLTIKGAGKTEDFNVTMHGDNRPWATYAKEITSVVAEEGVTHLPEFAFYGCENLTSVSLPGTLVNIAGCAFYGCRSLVSITLPQNLDVFSSGGAPDGKGSSVMVGLFGQCTALTEIKVADGNAKYKSVDGVLYFGIANRWRLAAYPAGRTDATFTVPDQTPVIMVGAFADNTALKEITLPQSCGEIQVGAFRGCTGLEKMTLLQPTGQVSARGDALAGVDMTKVKIFVPAKILENYTTRADSDWKQWASQISGQ
jgi:hypothetical protein